jgi:hypothetical protein
MRRTVLAIVTAMVAVVFGVALMAQQTTQIHPGKGGSPHVKSEWTVDGANISITYGRPYLKGRTVGQEIAPFGKVWRTGADEATTLITDRELRFENLTVPPGTYTVFTLPGETEWHLIINRQTGQWGTQHSQEQDLGRVPMEVTKMADPVEQLTISIDDTAAGGTLRIEWGLTRATAPFAVG